jgi:hypothetical protein
MARATLSAVNMLSCLGRRRAKINYIRPPPANSISITPPVSGKGGGDPTPGSGNIATGENAGGDADRHSSCRQRNNWLVWIPAARATSEATAPGSSAAATIRSFSARDRVFRELAFETWRRAAARRGEASELGSIGKPLVMLRRHRNMLW